MSLLEKKKEGKGPFGVISRPTPLMDRLDGRDGVFSRFRPLRKSKSQKGMKTMDKAKSMLSHWQFKDGKKKKGLGEETSKEYDRSFAWKKATFPSKLDVERFMDEPPEGVVEFEEPYYDVDNDNWALRYKAMVVGDEDDRNRMFNGIREIAHSVPKSMSTNLVEALENEINDVYGNGFLRNNEVEELVAITSQMHEAVRSVDETKAEELVSSIDDALDRYAEKGIPIYTGISPEEKATTHAKEEHTKKGSSLGHNGTEKELKDMTEDELFERLGAVYNKYGDMVASKGDTEGEREAHDKFYEVVKELKKRGKNIKQIGRGVSPYMNLSLGGNELEEYKTHLTAEAKKWTENDLFYEVYRMVKDILREGLTEQKAESPPVIRRNVILNELNRRGYSDEDIHKKLFTKYLRGSLGDNKKIEEATTRLIEAMRKGEEFTSLGSFEDFKEAIEGEGWAINDYANMIAKSETDDERKILTHIRGEEQEHLEELMKLMKCETPSKSSGLGKLGNGDNKISWKYNRFGHVEVWNGPMTEKEADLYIQQDTDVKAFFEHIGVDPDTVNPGDFDIADDPGYFTGENLGSLGKGGKHEETKGKPESEEKYWERGYDKVLIVCPVCGNEAWVRKQWRTFTCYICQNIIERGKEPFKPGDGLTLGKKAKSMKKFTMEPATPQGTKIIPRISFDWKSDIATMKKKGFNPSYIVRYLEVYFPSVTLEEFASMVGPEEGPQPGETKEQEQPEAWEYSGVKWATDYAEGMAERFGKTDEEKKKIFRALLPKVLGRRKEWEKKSYEGLKAWIDKAVNEAGDGIETYQDQMYLQLVEKMPPEALKRIRDAQKKWFVNTAVGIAQR